MNNLISAKNLTCRFGSTIAVNNLSFNLNSGSILGFIGPNGSGKTTTLRMLLGLIPPDSGESVVLECPSLKLTPAIKERIGYVPEEDGLYGWKSVEKMLKFHGDFYPKYDHNYGKKLLEKFQLPPKTLVSRLSKGSKRRLSVVLALATKPDLLILDEPAAGFDPAIRRVLLDCLAEFVRDGNRSVLISTHILTDIERVADQIAIIRNGSLLLQKNLDELRDKCKILIFDNNVNREKIEQKFRILKWNESDDNVEVVVDNFAENHNLNIREIYPMNLEDIFVHLAVPSNE